MGAPSRVPANTFTLNINSTNGNTTMQADYFDFQAKSYRKFLPFRKISQNFILFYRNILKSDQINQIFPKFFKINPKLL